MDKKLHEHEQFMKNEVKKTKELLNKAKTPDEVKNIQKNAKDLYKYHREAVRNFQHERFIHLIVTIFFASMQILAIVATISLSLMPISDVDAILGWLMVSICLILFVTGIFYVRHYYQLENGVQRLYDFSKELYQIITPTNQK